MDSKFIQDLRTEINEIDTQILRLLGQRMKTVQVIGNYKKEHQLPIVQEKRWQEILLSAIANGKKEGLSEGFVNKILNAFHDESIRIQKAVHSK